MEKKRKPRKIKEKEVFTYEFIKPTLTNGLYIELPFIPPSVNELYFTNMHGNRTLSKVGIIFKNRVKEYLTNSYLEEIQKLNPKGIYSVDMTFYLDPEEVFTKSYAKISSVKSPYRRRDIGNFEKILIDTVTEILMEDDCQIFSETLKKVASNERKVVILIKEVDPKDYLFNLDKETTDNILFKTHKYKLTGEI